MGSLTTQELDALLSVMRKHGVASLQHDVHGGTLKIVLDPATPSAPLSPEKPLEGTAAKEAAERTERELMYRSSEG